jgi:transposase
LKFPGYDVLSTAETDTGYKISVESTSKRCRCAVCNSSETVSYGRREKILYDLPIHGKSVRLFVNGQRCRCNACKTTFSQALPLSDSNRAMTSRLIAWIRKQSLTRTNYSIANQVGIVEGTVRAILRDAHLDSTA